MIYTDGSVTRDRSGWGFTVKQGGRTVHEDSGAHRVTTSFLTMEAEAVTHAMQWLASQRDARITHAVILTDSMNLLQKVESGIGCPDGHTYIQTHTRTHTHMCTHTHTHIHIHRPSSLSHLQQQPGTK